MSVSYFVSALALDVAVMDASRGTATHSILVMVLFSGWKRKQLKLTTIKCRAVLIPAGIQQL